MTSPTALWSATQSGRSREKDNALNTFFFVTRLYRAEVKDLAKKKVDYRLCQSNETESSFPAPSSIGWA